MSIKRKLRRQMELRKSKPDFIAIPKHTGNGFDLSQCKATDIDAIKLSSDDNQIEVELILPVGNFDSVAAYSEVFDLDAEHVPSYLIGAARNLAQACLRAVREKANWRREYPCATCTGACCKTFSSIRLTKYDVDLLESNGVDVGKQVVFYPDEAWTGHIGEFRLVPMDGSPHGACPNLTKTGCGIYEHRPEVCREFSAFDCTEYEPDPDKIDGKVRLRVMK